MSSAPPTGSPYSNDDYTVGWICAIETEYLAAQLCLDEEHLKLKRRLNDTNAYVLGKVAEHNVVIASLPDGSYGTSSAATVATNMLRSFPNIRIGLMVGIGGGAPSPDHDIRLGDIVVSSPGDGKGGVFQYDFGRTIQEQDFQETAFLNQPPTVLRTAVTDLKIEHRRKPRSFKKAIDSILEKEEEDLREELSRPDASSDRLYRSHIVHPPNEKKSCAEICGVDPSNLIPRPERTKRPDSPVVHYGLVASGNQLMKDALRRDELADKKKVLCFEMEAAGLMNDFPCLVVRGICDYSDTHKNDEWQGYAALGAAAYAKDLLKRIPPDDVEAEKKIVDILSDVKEKVDDLSEGVHKLVCGQQHQTATQREMQQDDKNEECLTALHATNPRHDKERIKDTKGGLLPDSSNWILGHQDFLRWRDDDQSRLLWIKGDPGKGKTMLLIAIVEELERQLTQLGTSRSTTNPVVLSYFFCQGTDSRLNNATAVLKGLVYFLGVENSSLVSHLRKNGSPRVSEGVDTFFALRGVLEDMLHDASLSRAYIVVDALDECGPDLPQLLKFIVHNSSVSPRLKWIVSSRNRPDIEQQLKLDNSGMKLSLELTQNAEQVAHAVNAYIDFKISELLSLDNNVHKLRVRDTMRQKANGTFLWVALVVQELKEVQSWHVLKVVEEMPAGLEELYARMIMYIQKLERDSDFCRLVLSTVTLAYRPLRLAELGVLSGLPKEIVDVTENTRNIVAMCGSFLTIQDDYIYLIHQSVKDYLSDKVSSTIFPSGPADVHHAIFSRSLQAMSTLRRDIYNLHYPGLLIGEIKAPDPDPLAAIRYSCVHWISHFCDAYSRSRPEVETVSRFLREKYLYWLEALGLIQHIEEAILLITRLGSLLKEQSSDSEVLDLIQDSRRFILQNRWIIENAPLQTYASALIFSPVHCLIRDIFKDEEPEWIKPKPVVEHNWSSCLQTLEGHSGSVMSVAFSDNSELLASGSSDKTIKVWNTATGSLRQTLKGHSSQVWSVIFSHNSKLLASASHDKTIKVWDIAAGSLQQTLKDYNNSATSVAFSHDSKLLASGSDDTTIKVWNIVTGSLQQTLKGHSNSVRSVVFSHDSKLLASGSHDTTIKVWDTAAGSLQQTLEGHSNSVESVTFSHDSKLLASGSDDATIKVWDIATGSFQHTLKAQSNRVKSVAFSHNSKLLASGSYKNKAINVWNITTRSFQQTLKGHRDSIRSVTFSYDSKLLASGSDDKTIKVWDTATGSLQHTLNGHSNSARSDAATGSLRQTLEGHRNSVRLVAFSHDSKFLASRSGLRGTIKVWDAATGSLQQTLLCYGGVVDLVAFSYDSKLLASTTGLYMTIQVWDIATRSLQRTLEGHDNSVKSVAFSYDSKLLVSASYNTIKVWDMATGSLRQTFEVHGYSAPSVAFSHDSRLLALAIASNSTIKVWDTATGSLQQTLEGYSDSAWSVIFSHNSKLLASVIGSHDKTIKVWDTATGSLRQTLEGHSSSVSAVAFSHDSKLLASATGPNKTIQVWDAATGSLQQTLKLSTIVRTMSFEDTGLYLDTNIGRIDLAAGTKEIQSLLRTPHPDQAEEAQYYGYALSSDKCWITWNKHRVLWLPTDYRPSAYAISSFASPSTPSTVTRIGIGCGSGRVVVIELLGSGPL